MSRVRVLDPDDFPDTLAAALGHPSNEDRIALGALTAWAVRPEIALAFVAFQRACESAARLPLRLRELVRLRIAFHNRCRSCMATRSARAVDDGMDDGAVCSLERPEEASDLSDAEKAALRYADLLATDHLAVDDSTFVALRKHFDDEAILELGVHIGTCVGFGRLAATFDLVDALPPGFRGDGAAPWTEGSVLR